MQMKRTMDSKEQQLLHARDEKKVKWVLTCVLSLQKMMKFLLHFPTCYQGLEGDASQG
jgi:hypothetical protein